MYAFLLTISLPWSGEEFCLKGGFSIFINFFSKAQPYWQLEKKNIAPQKRVYLDAFPSYDAGNYITIQQSDKNWC